MSPVGQINNNNITVQVRKPTYVIHDKYISLDDIVNILLFNEKTGCYSAYRFANSMRWKDIAIEEIIKYVPVPRDVATEKFANFYFSDDNYEGPY